MDPKRVVAMDAIWCLVMAWAGVAVAVDVPFWPAGTPVTVFEGPPFRIADPHWVGDQRFVWNKNTPSLSRSFSFSLAVQVKAFWSPMTPPPI